MKGFAFALAILSAMAVATGDASAARGKNGNGKSKANNARSGFTQVYGYTQRLKYSDALFRHIALSAL
jgi:hypothetical protein